MDTRCAVCKFLCRDCNPGCEFLNFVPEENPDGFKPIYTIFGVDYVVDLIRLHKNSEGLSLVPKLYGFVFSGAMERYKKLSEHEVDEMIAYRMRPEVQRLQQEEALLDIEKERLVAETQQLNQEIQEITSLSPLVSAVGRCDWQNVLPPVWENLSNQVVAGSSGASDGFMNAQGGNSLGAVPEIGDVAVTEIGAEANMEKN